MKKIMLFASALAGLFLAASCQQENLEPVQKGNTVTITVETPGAIGTKAVADGNNVTEVRYAVYKTKNGEDYSIDDSGEILGPLAAGVVEMSGKRASIDFDLLQDQYYTVIFWAQVAGKGHYTFGENGDLRTITVAKTVAGNDESRAAFYARYDFETFGHKDHEVTLKRPFAQLNLLTTLSSLTPEQEGQTLGYTVDVKESQVTVTGLSTTFNTLTGLAPEGDETFEFTLAPTPEESVENGGLGQETLTVNGTAYHYVSMNYFFVPEDEKLVDISYIVTTDKGNISNEIVAVPVKENYRTNVIGNLLTRETTFNIIVDAEFDGEVAPSALSLAAAFGGSVVLDEDVQIGKLAVEANLTLDLNGHTFTGVMEVAEGVTLALSNGTVVNEDKTVSGITSNGNLILDNVNVTSARHALRIESGTAVINGGEYRVAPISKSTLYALNVGDTDKEAVVTIKGGTFVGPKGTMADSGGAVAVKAGSTVNIEGGDFSGGKTKTISNNGTMTITGGAFDQEPAAELLGAGYEAVEKDAKWYVLPTGLTPVATSEELVAAMKAGNDVFFLDNITVAATKGGYTKAGIIQDKVQTIDGNGYTLTVTGAGATKDCAIYTNGGVIRNLTVAGAMRGIFTAGTKEDLYIENVTFKNVVYTFNSDDGNTAYGVYITDTKLYGWTSHTNKHKEVVYTNCYFGEGNGYKYCRPYGKTSFIGCTFCPGYSIDKTKTTELTFTDCIYE